MATEHADVGPVDVVKSKCQQSCCVDDGKNFTPIPLVLACPECHWSHIDEGEWLTRKHRRHQCQNNSCPYFLTHGERYEWQPSLVFTVGVAGK